MLNLDYVAIGTRIKQRRKQLSLTQKQLAELVNLSEGSISRYEHGKVEDATMTKLRDFAEALHVSPSWLIGIKEQSEFETRLKAIIKKSEDVPEQLLIRILDLVEENINILLEVYNERFN